jgi:hypothetical protein
MSAPRYGQATAPAPATPVASVEGGDLSFSTFLHRRLDNIIDRNTSVLQGMSMHLDTLLGSLPSKAEENVSQPGPNGIFSVIEMQLVVLMRQTEWLENLAQRLYKV